MSSSSDSEDDTLLREALAPGFTLEAVKKASNKITVPCRSSQTTLVKQLRFQPEESGQQRNNGLLVTPEQQKHIARELGEFIESQLKEVDVLSKAWKNRKIKPSEGDEGVRLLGSSRLVVSTEEALEEDIIQFKPKRKRRTVNIDGVKLSASEMLREAAVSASWVLEGKGVYGKNCVRGEVITGAVHAEKLQTKPKI